MNTIGERVQIIREQADDGNKLTLEKFGNRISLTNQAVSAIEKGKSNPSKSTIDLICREFDINREWLETGKGPMKKEKPPLDEVAEIVSDILDKGNEDLFYGFILAATKAYQELGERDKEFVQSYINKMLTIQHDSFSKDTEE